MGLVGPRGEGPPGHGWRRALPRLPRHLARRDRVRDVLMCRPPLTVLTAPHGFGKTVALVAWLQETFDDQDAVVWFDATPGMTSETAWSQILRGILAAQGRPGDLGRESDAGGVRPLAAIDAVLRETPTEITLALDSVENITDRSFPAEVARLTSRHRHVHTVMATRLLDGMPADLEHLVDTTFLLQGDLGFQKHDTLELLDDHDVRGEDAELFLSVHHAVHGWPTLVHRAVLLLIGRRGQGSGTSTDAATGQVLPFDAEDMEFVRVRVAEYLADTLLPILLTPEQLALATLCSLVCAVDETSVALLADGLRDRPAVGDDESRDEWRRLRHELADLARTGVLVRRQQTDHLAWRMSPLVARALTDVAKQSLPLARIERLQRAFIDHHVGRGDWAAAIHGAVDLGDLRLLADLVGRGWAFISLTHPGLLDEAFSMLPEPVLVTDPVAASARAIFWNTASDGSGPEQLPDDEDGLRAMACRDDVAEVALTHLTHMVAARLSGRLGEAAERTDRLSRLTRSAERAQPTLVADLAPAIHVQAAATAQLVDDLPGAGAHLRRALKVAGMDPSGLTLPDAQGRSALQEAMLGRMRLAADWVSRARAHSTQENWLGPRVHTPRLLAEAWLGMERIDRERVRPVMDRLLAQMDDDEMWGHIVEAKSFLDLLSGDSWSALDHLQELRRGRGRHVLPGSYADIAMTYAAADHELVLGLGTRVAQTLLAAPSDHPGTGIRRANLALLGQDHEAVLGETFAGRRLSVRQRTQVDLLRACAHLALDDVDAASRCTRWAVRRMQNHDLRIPLLSLPANHLVELKNRIRLAPSDLALLEEALDMSPSLLPERLEIVQLTTRERAVLHSLAEGMSVQQMAAAHFLSVNTIKTQLRGLYRKLDAGSRHEAVVRARDIGLIAEYDTGS